MALFWPFLSLFEIFWSFFLTFLEHIFWYFFVWKIALFFVILAIFGYFWVSDFLGRSFVIFSVLRVRHLNLSIFWLKTGKFTGFFIFCQIPSFLKVIFMSIFFTFFSFFKSCIFSGNILMLVHFNNFIFFK